MTIILVRGSSNDRLANIPAIDLDRGKVTVRAPVSECLINLCMVRTTFSDTENEQHDDNKQGDAANDDGRDDPDGEGGAGVRLPLPSGRREGGGAEMAVAVACGRREEQSGEQGDGEQEACGWAFWCHCCFEVDGGMLARGIARWYEVLVIVNKRLLGVGW